MANAMAMQCAIQIQMASGMRAAWRMGRTCNSVWIATATNSALSAAARKFLGAPRPLI